LAIWAAMIPVRDLGCRPQPAPGGQAQRGRSAIDVAAVAHVSDPHETSLVTELVQDPVVTDPRILSSPWAR
jgi:hypothetical protein